MSLSATRISASTPDYRDCCDDAQWLTRLWMSVIRTAVTTAAGIGVRAGEERDIPRAQRFLRGDGNFDLACQCIDRASDREVKRLAGVVKKIERGR